MTYVLAGCLIVIATAVVLSLSGGAKDRSDEVPLPPPLLTPLPNRYHGETWLAKPKNLAAGRGVWRA